MKKVNIFVDTKVTTWRRDYLEVETPSQDYMEAILQANIAKIIPLLENLTPKEKKLLRFIAEGRPMKSSGIPDITYRYSDKLMQSIRAKFGGISKGRLIYYIGLLRLLNYL